MDDADNLEDDELDMMSDEEMFMDNFLAESHKKPFELDYKCLDIEGLEQAQRKEVEHIAGMFVISTGDAAVLLRHFQWNKEKLIERYMDEPEAVKRDAGVLDLSLIHI